MARYILSLMLLLSLWAGTVSASYKDAEKSYSEGDYTKALTELQNLESHEGSSANLYYDMGNCYVELGDLGNARVYYERARRMDPSSKAIGTNLNYVSSRVDDANKASMQGKRGSVLPDETGFIGNVHTLIAADHTSDYWALFAIMAFLLMLGSIALYLFPSNIAARKVGFFGGALFLFFSVIFIAFSVMAKNEASRHDYGVITEYKTELLTEPQNSSKPSSSPLTQGTKVRIIGEEADVEGNVSWYKVRLNSDYQGWLPADELEII
ncbi:MAG: tetratricopeptide repeat protein [Bacteroides sp.]|nr:tetratricopeptide repeat protein [Bacteroides sp.]